MAYSTCAMVAALIPNLLNAASNLDDMAAEIRPASSEIRRFMSGGCSLIESKIQSLGFNPPTSGAIYDFLGDIEASYAAWRAEVSRSSPRTAKGERDRADAFRKAYEAGLRQIGKMDLGLMGLNFTHTTGARWYLGGISKSRVDAVKSDTDRVERPFPKDKFRNPDADTDDEQER